MTRDKSTLAARPAARAAELRITDMGTDSAIVISDDTTPAVAHSRVKQALMATLARVFEWSPPLAITLARAIAWCWPHFKET
jgi:hypothetical protein